MGVCGRFSVSFDTLTRYLFSNDFLDRNPRFESLRDTFAHCKATYQQELDKAGCSCRMTTGWAKTCVEQVILILEDAKINDHDTVRRFIRFVGKRSDNEDVDQLGVNILIGNERYDITVVKQPT